MSLVMSHTGRQCPIAVSVIYGIFTSEETNHNPLPRFLYKSLPILYWLLSAVAPGFSQEVSYTLYNENNGLNRSSINDIQRDGRGYYWLATEKGVIRFDGRNFTEILPDMKAFRTQEARKIHLEADSLYIIYRDSGCLALDLRYLNFREVTREPVSDIQRFSPVSFFIYYRNGILERRYPGGLQRTAIRSRSTQGIFTTYAGELLLSLPGNGVFIVDTLTLKWKRKLDLISEGYFESFSKTPDNLYFITNGRIRMIDDSFHVKEMTELRESDRLNVSYFKHVSPGHEILIRNNKFLVDLRSGRQRRLDLPGLINFELKNVFVQDSANILTGTNQGLVHVKIGLKATNSIDEKIEDSSRTIRIRRKVWQEPDGTLYLFGNPFTYILGKDGKLRKISDDYISMYDALPVDGYLYVATEGRGLIRFRKGSNRIEYIDPDPLNKLGQYNALGYDPDRKLLYIGGSQLLIRYDIRKGQASNVTLPPGTGFVRQILYDSVHKRIWAGTRRGVICFDRDMQVLREFKTGRQELGGENVGDILIRRNTDELWVGHDNGVDIIDIRKMRRVRSLPPGIFVNPRIVSLLEDDQGRIWMGTYSGIVGYDPATGSINRLGKNNKLLNIEFNYKSALKLNDGKLVFGGLNGYDVIDPNKINFNRRNDTGIFTGIHRFVGKDTVFRSLTGKEDKISFNIEKEYLRIYISSSDILNAVNHTYEYRIGGEQWNSISGPSYINIFRLDPGIYQLEVRAFDEYGSLVNFEPLKIEATVPFLRSRLFLLLLTLFAFLFLILFVFVLLRSKLQEKKLKERISMDLHDEVGTILTRALYVARMDEPDRSNNRLINYLNESLFSLRAYINTMNYANFTFRQLTDEMKEMSNSFLNNSGYATQITAKSDNLYEIKGELYRDIKLCLYEIMTNTLKYANGSSFHLYVTARHDVLTILTRDNGILKSTEQLGTKGNGMRNLRKRAAKHHGQIEFSVPRNSTGLMIKMKFPL
jgi:hypothetical protein